MFFSNQLLRLAIPILAIIIWMTPAKLAALEDTIAPQLFSKMEWRFVGPYRGGRVLAVTGVAGNPYQYYMGSAGGGVWKTDNAGQSWSNISDEHFNVGTIGSIAVANSNPNVIYVGTGEGPIRGVTTSHGDGIYKTTDAGKTWQHMGLKKAGQIPKIRIHPTNPNIAWAAVQGTIWGPSKERGVYKTTDGGKSWQQVLSVNENTGAADLSIDPANPRILFATMWHHGRSPWYITSGGEGGGIYKSVDGGDNWKQLEKGLPELVGKIGIDVSAANSNRVYAVIEAEKGGIYRSDDAGESWSLQNSDRIIQARAWYYNHIKADPVEENTLYVMNAPFMKSIDGGKTFFKVDTPHGDHHDHWINPQNNKNMINANDGGATITFDGGKTWSSIYNQPTAQFYRVTTDNLSPYNIYGGQQDNATMAIASETFDKSIDASEQFAVGGGESAHIAFDPQNPRLIYATTINSTLTEYDREGGRVRSIMPYPEYVFGRNPKDQKYRTNWNAPVLVSAHNPKVIYYATQMLLKTTDRGVNWEEISPDLTRNDKSKQQQNGGPLTNEQAGAEFYNTIFYIAESPRDADTLWVGADDGLLHISRDGGKNWQNITPKKSQEALINAIELSPHAAGTAYIAVAGYKLNDSRPYIYKTTDFGKRWKRIDKGLPKDTFVRVVREDPKRKGLLYAGTEAGMFISFDDGKHWQSFKQNLPVVPITDLTFRQGDLIVATQGRGFWVMDDLAPLQEVQQDFAKKSLHVFKVTNGRRINGGGGGTDLPDTKNPARGATFKYYLKDDLADDAKFKIEVLDEAGSLVKTFSATPSEADKCALANMDQREPLEIKYPSTKTGMQSWVWDLRRERIHCIDNVKLFSGWNGARVMPGNYQVRITAGDNNQTISFKVTADPRLDAQVQDFAAVEQKIKQATTLMNDLMSHLESARLARSQMQQWLELYGGKIDGLKDKIDTATQHIIEWELAVTQPNHETFDDDLTWPNMLDVQLRFIIDVIDNAGVPLQQGTIKRLNDLTEQWQIQKQALQSIFRQHIEAINQQLTKQGLPYISEI
ncbi:MAG: photosystem II stability/assembly factor-like uncharacterized protein [Paraglaciecola sp.]|jgi:photosystem II stability/assembly factor-like uncharacterized protein